jgi:hypothetical protein
VGEEQRRAGVGVEKVVRVGLYKVFCGRRCVGVGMGDGFVVEAGLDCLLAL